MAKSGDIVVGLDIGTTKTASVIAEVTDEGLEIIGVGLQPSAGLRKGVVINIERTVASIHGAIEKAEATAKCEISSVVAGISGGHIKGLNSDGIIAIKGREIVASDIERVIDAARAVAIPEDRRVIHVIPQVYKVDDQGGIKDPEGMAGVRLQAKVHIITGAKSAIQNIITCCHKSGLQVERVALQQIASAESVLSEEEKELGVAVIDIGGGTTDIVVFQNGAVRHTAVLPIGGNHITNDIAVGLRIPLTFAEQLKRKYGNATASAGNINEMIPLGTMANKAPKQVKRAFLLNIIEPRVEEIFELARREIEKVGPSNLMSAGVVLCGGTSLLEGITQASEDILEVPVRCGLPTMHIRDNSMVASPMFATAVGLVIHRSRHFGTKLNTRPGNVMMRVRDWLEKVF